MAWNDDLLPEQAAAASHDEGHARMLAGPGTGKTLALTRRICFLMEERGTPPDRILALTFTRAAARELAGRVARSLPQQPPPRIATLHSFALRQLLRNAGIVAALPQPLRVADDWEERYIVLEDLKAMLGLKRISQAKDLLGQLSADWQTLTAEEDGWDQRFPDPAFLGAWQTHRERYGYTLRSELVYQLKRALEQYGQFALEGLPLHLLVDEYQDLNRCDLAIVASVAARGARLFIAGDDDQSIYGFRKAHPNGIRRYPEDYPGASDRPLTICKRCARSILDLGVFVARQDHTRIEKPLVAEAGRGPGNVELLRFPEEESEAEGIAGICAHLSARLGLRPDQILVLLRSDRNRAFSEPIRARLAARGVPVASRTNSAAPLDSSGGRELLSLLRLLRDENDHLAWRTLLEIRPNGIGDGGVTAIHDLCQALGRRFGAVVHQLREDQSPLPARFRKGLGAELGSIWALREQLRALIPLGPAHALTFSGAITQMIGLVLPDGETRQSVLGALQVGGATSIGDLLATLEVADDAIEQDIEAGTVNILTMHKAKGLTAEAVIIAATEDEYIPGRAIGDALGDERRLLYVSLTRAREYLFITYCDGRPGAQRHTGRHPGQVQRSLTQFLRHGPLAPVYGPTFVRDLAAAR